MRRLRHLAPVADSVLQNEKFRTPSTRAAVVLGCLLAAAARADCPPESPPQSSRRPAIHIANTATAVKSDEPIEITSAGGELSLTGDAVLKGKVNVRQGERTLSAENANYEAQSGDLSVQGGVELHDPNVTVTGTGAHIQKSGAATIDQAHFELAASAGRGDAKQIQLDPQGRLHLDQVRYTTCPVGNTDWELKASQISVDQGKGVGDAHNVRVDFKGVPILYLPVISFPVSNERKSGFLFPNFGTSSRSGTTLGVPWYWNIAPNYDATLGSNWLSQRGYELDSEFRYLTENSTGNFRAQVLPHDDLYGANRSLLKFEDQTDLSEHLRFSADASNASDDAWFEDFGQGPEGTSVTYLNRLAQLTYLDDHWLVTARAQNFQTIDTTLKPTEQPYTVVPQLAFQGNFPLGSYGLDSSIYGELAHFTRSVGADGTRFDVMPQIRMPLQSAAMFLIPAAALSYTAYNLSGLPPGSDRSPTRSAPILSLDSGVVFERLTGSHQQRLQTFEPRLLYVYVPYRNQDALPVFDTTTPDLNLVQLFRTNRFIGPDRLGDANQVSMGVTSRLVDAASGRQFLSATVGQTYYFTNPRVQLPLQPEPSVNSSDIIAQVELSAYKNWNVHLGLQWDPHTDESQKSEVRFQYQPAPDRVVNLAYRFRRDSVEQWDASAAWPLSSRWSGYARMVYSVLDNKTIDRFVGLEYRSCCWSLRLVQRRYLSNRQGRSDDSLQIQLELKGLSSVGESADTFLERAIRGYSARPTATALP